MTQNQNKIYVGNLTFDASLEEVRAHFSQYGSIADVRIITDRETRKSKGYGFITYEDAKGAQASLAADGAEFKGRKLKVNIAREEQRNGGGGGGPRSQGGRKHY